MNKRSNIWLRTFLALVITSTATLAFTAAPASAATDHGITGTAYANGDLYISANVRSKEGAGSITATFVSLPKNGLFFEILNPSYGVIGTPQTWTQQETSTKRTLATSVSNGQNFYNAFRLSGSCPNGGCSPYNFTGTENY